MTVMQPQPPSVSIGLPVYNGERYLAKALEAILSQTYQDFEVLISDNASSDRTAEICEAFVKRDTRIRYCRNGSNVGAARNFNAVFQRSQGRYFRWATADDLFPPESLERCVSALDSHPEAVLCYPKTILIDEIGKVIRPYEDNLDLRSTSAVKRFLSAMKRIGLVNVQYGLIRADALRQTSLMGNYPGGDIPLVLELTLHGQFMEISDTCFYRRMHSQALSSVSTMEGDQEFWDPKTKGRVFLRTWRHYGQYLRSTYRAPLTVIERMRLSVTILRLAVASRATLLSEIFRVLNHGYGRHS